VTVITIDEERDRIMDEPIEPGSGSRPASLECQRAGILINRAIDGDLPAGGQEALDSHLAGCVSCRETMAELQALEILLESQSGSCEAPPPFLAQRIMSSLPARMVSSWWQSAARPAAVAATLLLAVSLGYLGRDLFPSGPAAGPAIQSVRIIFYSPDASSVALVGDFNEWGKRPVAMAHSDDRGIWEFSLNLPAGVYHYNLLVDGERWSANPKASTLVPDGFGGYDSVLVVSEKCQNDCS
jgi:hypothetical protein